MLDQTHRSCDFELSIRWIYVCKSPWRRLINGLSFWELFDRAGSLVRLRLQKLRWHVSPRCWVPNTYKGEACNLGFDTVTSPLDHDLGYRPAGASSRLLYSCESSIWMFSSLLQAASRLTYTSQGRFREPSIMLDGGSRRWVILSNDNTKIYLERITNFHD